MMLRKTAQLVRYCRLQLPAALATYIRVRREMKTEQLSRLIWGTPSNLMSLVTFQIRKCGDNILFLPWYFKQWMRKRVLRWMKFYLHHYHWGCQNRWGNFRRGDETKNISENEALGCWEAALRESALKHSPQPSSEHLQTPLWSRTSAVVHCAWGGSNSKLLSFV